MSNLQQLFAQVVEHVRGMWRYRWWAVGVAWVLALAGQTVVYSIPNVYRASAKVFVDTHSMLGPLMKGLAVDTNTMNEAQLVGTAVLTRPNLEKVAYKTDLALRAHTPEEFETLISGLQRQIHVVTGGNNVFTIEYEEQSREKARDVVAALVDAFIEGTLGNEGSDAEMTERAVANEVQVHEQRLQEAEERLARFKQDNLGFMPGQAGDYYTRLQTAMANVAATEEKLKQLADKRDELQRQIGGEAPVFGIMAAPEAGLAAGCTRGTQVAQLRAQLAALRLDFTEKHPRVVSLEEQLSLLEKDCQAEAQRTAASPTAALQGANSPLDLNPVFQQLRIQLSTTQVDLAEFRSRLTAEQEQVAQLRRDVDKITEVEAQLKQLNRDYDVVQARHQELIRRWEDLQAKKRLDPVTDKGAFRRLEPPFAKATPVAPNRPLLLAGVLILALGAGAAVAFALNQMNLVFFTNEGLVDGITFPVLGSISMMLTSDQMARRRKETVGWIAAVVLLVVFTGAVMVFAQAPLLRALLPGGGA
jgi:polysaccharide chain length determinant protein (PEP-CTERM system associated)